MSPRSSCTGTACKDTEPPFRLKETGMKHNMLHVFPIMHRLKIGHEKILIDARNKK